MVELGVTITRARPVRYKLSSTLPSTDAERWWAARRLVGFLFVAFVAWLILTQPITAANAVNPIASFLRAAAHNVTVPFDVFGPRSSHDARRVLRARGVRVRRWNPRFLHRSH